MKRNQESKPRLMPIVKIADFTAIPEYGWYLCNDGNIWYCTHRVESNEGDPAWFLKFADGKRLKWREGYPEKLNP